MDMGQTAVLSAILVLVGMVFLGPAITEKALAMILATATGKCGVADVTLATATAGLAGLVPCEFTFMNKELKQGVWRAYPTSGTSPQWETAGSACAGNLGCSPENEEGSVHYKVGGGEASLYFNSPWSGNGNKCEVKILSEGPGKLSGTCHAGSGVRPMFTYTLLSGVK